MSTNTRSMLVAATIVLGLGGAAAARAQVSTAGAGPYYATPSWDQKITTGRFVVLTNWNNEAVLDRETGLVWEKSPSTTLWGTAPGAQNYCNALAVNGRKGWRLPGVQELASLIDPTVFNPALLAGHPFVNVQSFAYFTSTAGRDGISFWAVILANGLVQTQIAVPSYAWCVRGGQGADVQ